MILVSQEIRDDIKMIEGHRLIRIIFDFVKSWMKLMNETRGGLCTSKTR